MQQKEKLDFQMFWDAYALKRDRIAAERAWKRLSSEDRRAAFAGIGAYREYCEQRGISRMYAQGYLNHRRWEDEPEDTPHIADSRHDGETAALIPDARSGDEIEIW